MTFAQLEAADPGRWRRSATAFRTLAEAIADRADGIASVVASLGAAWAGSAASSAIAHLTALRADLGAAFPELVGVDQALSEFADTIEVARSTVRDATRGSTVHVDSDGIAVAAPGGTAAEVAAAQAAIDDAIYVAHVADRQAAVRITATTFEPATVGPARVPAMGSDPAAVSTWWAGLSDEQRRHLVAYEPAAVDSLDGVPADARDQAGRILAHEMAIPAALRARLDNVELPRAYVLGIGDGRAIVSVGDPDRAADVLTFVPGVGASLATVAPTVAAVDNLRAAAGPDVAVVDWIGYDAPRTIQAAMSETPAQAGAATLARFDQGLRVTHTGPGAHDTMVGYSYGSTVAGLAAAGGGLRDDDIIFVGSPGVGVDHATDLGIDPAHVWATVATDDAVRLAVDPTGLLSGDDPRDHLWFGTAPTASQFGARVFGSDPGSVEHPVLTHESYFNAGSQALTGIVRISTGDAP